MRFQKRLDALRANAQFAVVLCYEVFHLSSPCRAARPAGLRLIVHLAPPKVRSNLHAYPV